MSEELARVRAKRRGNRTVLTKLTKESECLLKDETINKARLKVIANALEEKLALVKSLDDEIISKCDVDDIEFEIEESDEVNSRVMETMRVICEAIEDDNKRVSTATTMVNGEYALPVSGVQSVNNNTTLDPANVPSSPQASGSFAEVQSFNVPTGNFNTQGPGISGMAFHSNTNFSTNANHVNYQTKVKLPKLALPKFRGEVTLWQNFWDSFNSAVHSNPDLSQIDKFNHLHSLLEGQASHAIQGLTRSEANYNSAIEILRSRFGRPQAIISRHMDELLKIPACNNDRASQLRFVYDKISINVRGLESLGVSSSQYGSLLIPVIMSKLPQEVRIQIARNTAKEVWEMSDLLEVIRQEVEAREISEGVKANVEKPKQTPMRSPSSAALLVNDHARSSNKANRIRCAYCNGLHFSASCESVSDPQARYDILRRDRRCFVCLKPDHRSDSCNKTCRRCRGKHHQSICRQPLPWRPSSASNENIQDSQESTHLASQTADQQPRVQTITTASTGTMGDVLLQTATAIAKNVDGTKFTKVKILFDSGSQRSYVTNNLRSKLDLKPVKTETLHLNTFGEKNFRKQKCDVLTLMLENRHNEPVRISVLGFPVICSPLPARVDASSYPHLEGLHLADCSDNQDSIDVLVGSDYYWDFVTSEIVRGDFGPTAINSKFGWLLSGPTEFNTNVGTTVNLIISGTSNDFFEPTYDPVIETLRQFWDTESIGIKEEIDLKTRNNCFNENIRFNGTRYEVELPWKVNHPAISSDYELCLARLKSLQRKMLREPDLLYEYNQIIDDQLRKGIVERVSMEVHEPKASTGIHYLPHHAVIRRDRETTKLRIVYDGSAKPPERHYSLNDCLETGPNSTPLLFDTLVKFRWHKIGLTADIEKAFLMVGINEADRDMLRFLWFEDPSKLNSDIVQLRFTRLVFGLRPSPAILASTIRHHLDTQLSEEFKAELIEMLKNSLYVDDLVTGEGSETEALELYSKARVIMQRGGFNLRKWRTNSKIVQETITDQSNDSVTSSPCTHDSGCITEEDESFAKSTTGPAINVQETTDYNVVKVLGTIWNTATDEFMFNFLALAEQAKLLPTTKRSLLKISAKVFDPLGLLSPFTIQWKILFQDLCQARTNWDEHLADGYLKKWKTLISSLQLLNSVHIPRCYFTAESCKLKSAQLHCFSDASERAYAAAIYLRSAYDNGHIEVKLITAKTRVAQAKRQTTPRLELLGATILVRLAKTVQNALPRKLEAVYWVDSITVVCWIKNAKPWKQYVMNRVQEIRDGTTSASWRHCPGELNPADIPSRGMTASDLVKETNWWNGPEFLTRDESEWPRQTHDFIETEDAMNEIIKNPTPTTHVLTISAQVCQTGIQHVIDASRYSSLKKLLRVTACVLRFTKRSVNTKGPELTAGEMRYAEELWIKAIQYQTFSGEICHVSAARNTSPPILVRQFSLFVDDRGITRCRGRIQNCVLNQECKTPMLLPSKHHVVDLIVREIHERMFHSGVNTTLTAVRERFWILRGRQTVKRIIRRCVTCRRLEGKSFPLPQSPELPEERVSDDPSFAHTGVDFAGPLITADAEDAKAYVCLFTCASTRAVHLELTRRLSSEAFLLAFRRFTSRRGLPATLLSDNAKSFKAASKDIKKIARSKAVHGYMTNNGVTWKFIVERAAWWGGFWERLVQSVKRTLKKAIGRGCLSFEELHTLLIEVESVINSRPLTYVSDDLDGISYALTPSHLINGRRLQNTANSSQFEIVSTHESLTRRSRHQKHLLNQFTTAWRKDYLLGLRDMHARNARTRGENPEIAVGDIVLLQNDSTKRVLWKLAIVKELLPARDGVIRAAVVQAADSRNLLKRSIKHLIPIEVKAETENLMQSQPTSIPVVTINRLRRIAAINGELSRRNCLN